jgi:hypothetical protein
LFFHLLSPTEWFIAAALRRTAPPPCRSHTSLPKVASISHYHCLTQAGACGKPGVLVQKHCPQLASTEGAANRCHPPNVRSHNDSTTAAGRT